MTVAIQKLIELAFIQLSLRFSSFSVFVDIVYCTSYLLMPVRMKILHLGSQSLGHCACSLDLHQTSWDPVHRCHLQFSNSCQGERTVAGRFRRGLAISVLVHAVVMCGMRTENECMALTCFNELEAIASDTRILLSSCICWSRCDERDGTNLDFSECHHLEFLHRFKQCL